MSKYGAYAPQMAQDAWKASIEKEYNASKARIEEELRNRTAAAGSARGHCHWGLRRSSLWGHEPCEGCGDMDMRKAVAKRGAREAGEEEGEERRGRMRTWPRGRSVELPMGPRTV